MADLEDLPRAHVKRIVKAKLLEIVPAATVGDKKEREVVIAKEALQAFAECAKVFIHYLTANANDICHESKRQTISPDDVLRALEETDFQEFIEPLREALTVYRTQAKKKAEAGKKRKAEGEPGGAEDGEGDGAGGDGGGDDAAMGEGN